MNKSGKIIYINLGVLLFYSLIVRLVYKQNDQLSMMLLSAFLVFCHSVFNLGTGVSYRSNGNKEKGNSYLLSSVLVLVIGFGVCLGNANI